MKIQVVLLLTTLLASVCAEVKFDEPMVAERPEPEQGAVDDGETSPEGEADPAGVLEELEQQIFDQVGSRLMSEPSPQSEPRPRPKSPKKCCKLGRQVAENGLFCDLDLHLVQKRPNVVHRRKMKFHGPETHGQTVYKDLMRRVEKCALSKASQSMFSKCCEWQEFIQHELSRCKTLPTISERRECRRRVQSRE